MIIMKIKLLVSREAVGCSQVVGQEIDVSEAEAGRMIEAGQAVFVRSFKSENTSKKARSEKANK